MGFMVSKGQLEIDIIVVKGLTKSGLVQPPGIIFIHCKIYLYFYHLKVNQMSINILLNLL